MNEINNIPEGSLQELFLEAINKIKENDLISLSDIFVSVSFDDLTLSIYDDEEGLVAHTYMDGWNVFKQDTDTFEQNVIDLLRGILHREPIVDALESLDVIRPFAVVYVTKDFEQKEELIRLDDHLIVLEDEVLQNIDRELDEFLKKLLSDL